MTLLSGFCTVGNFMPHGYCYLWQPTLVALHVLSDFFITLAYMVIPTTLVCFIRKRNDLPFHWIILCFGTFIIACGATHAMEIITVWRPYYWLSGIVKAITAIASVMTAILLIKYFPQMVAIPSPAQLRKTNKLLEEEIKERMRTEQVLAQQANELARSNNELEQFAYVASHDLKEPLRMISSFTQLLEKRYDELLDAEGKQFMWYIVDGAKRMKLLIDDLLAYARLGKRKDNFKVVSCEQIIGTVLADLKVMIEENQAQVFKKNLPSVKFDPLLLGQLFQNLIINAIKFKRELIPKVTIDAIRKDEQWLFRIQDNGIGIEEKYYDRIFGLFQRLHTKDEYMGTGIGLAICKKIVVLHGGDIWVESTPGEGTTFYFTVPVCKEAMQ